MKKPKRINKSREQIIADLKSNEKFQEKMKFTREMFYPALCEATTSIDDATQNLAIINTVLMEKVLGWMKDKKFSELKMHENLSEEDPQYEGLKNMLVLFDDMSVYDAKELLEGMRNEINLFVSEENKTRKLSELKTKWIDEL